MSSLIKWSPFGELDSFFDDAFRFPSFPSKDMGWDLAVDANKVSAECKNGVLRITMPKKEAKKQGKVKIKVK